ncbi:hypothetical protein KY343_01750 [Candidatus Woesearchaeota archaeon]|nr:hypothetical protein [Candidatus Woesearchaeota archaeon]
MAELILRRGFLETLANLGKTGAAVAAVNAVAPGCASSLEEIAETTVAQAVKLPQITVYAVRPNRAKDETHARENRGKILSPYTDQAYDIVREFYREELGIDLNFVYCENQSQVPDNLDRKGNIVLIEKQFKEGAFDTVFEKAEEAYFEGRIDESRKLMRRARLEQRCVKGMAESESNLVFVKYNGREWSGFFFSEFAYDKRKKISAYRIRRAVTKAQKWLQKDLLKTAKTDFEKASELVNPKYRAFFIAHELGHRLGLWHSFQYKNDGIEDFDGKLPNFLSYEMARIDYNHKYGFSATKSQAKWASDFAAGREPYLMMVEAGWKFGRFLKAVQQKNGYIESTDRPGLFLIHQEGRE